MNSADRYETSSPFLLRAAVFLACYLTVRPINDVMFTASDILFIAALVFASRQPLTLQPFGDMTLVWLLAVGMVLTGLFIGSVGDGDPVRWIIVALQYCFAWLLLPMLLIGHDEDRTASLTRALILGVVVMQAIGALVYFFYKASFEETRALLGLDFLTGTRRLGAFTADANWNGAIAAMTLPFVANLYLRRRLAASQAVVAVLLLGLGLVLSASFTAFVSAALAIAVFALFRMGRISLRAWLALGIGGLLIWQGWAFFPPVFSERVGRALTSGDIAAAGTYVGRAKLAAEAWGMTDRTLLIGIGADQYRVVSALKAPVHNVYLLLWVEGGIIALIGWLLMMLVLVATGIGALRHDRLAAATTLAVLVVFLVFTNASPHMYARLWPVPVLLAVALSRQASAAAAARRDSADRQAWAALPGR